MCPRLALGLAVLPSIKEVHKPGSSRGQLGKKLLNPGDQQKPGEAAAEEKLLTNTDYRQDPTPHCKLQHKTRVAWLDTDTVSEKAQGVLCNKYA